MAKKAHRQNREFKFDPYDDFDDIDDDFDAKILKADFDDSDWEDASEWNYHGSARRKIERRNEMKKLYSELNDWEEFGESESWYPN